MRKAPCCRTGVQSGGRPSHHVHQRSDSHYVWQADADLPGVILGQCYLHKGACTVWGVFCDLHTASNTSGAGHTAIR